MTVLQKLDLFEKKTFEAVERQRREAAREIQDAIEASLREAEKEARSKLEERIKAERYKLERQNNKKIYAAAVAARKAKAELQKRLLDELFADLEKDLRNFAASMAYGDFLLEGIAAVMEQDLPIIRFMAKDMIYKGLIEDGTQFIVEEAEEDFIGGFKLMSDRVIIDYTLLGELNERRNDFWNQWPDTDNKERQVPDVRDGMDRKEPADGRGNFS